MSCKKKQVLEITENMQTAERYILEVLSLLYPQLNDQFSVALKQRIQSANVIYFDRNEEHNIRIPVIGNHNLLTEICVQKNNKTVDFVPVLHNSKIIEIQPVLLLDRQASRFTVIHEMCHLLSIGDYFFFGSEIVHKFGILSYRYQLLNGELKLRECIGDKIENENITNAITESIVRIIDENIINTSVTGQLVAGYFL